MYFTLNQKSAEKSITKSNNTAAIVKAKSPSCGYCWIHNGLFDGGLVPGNGVFTQMLIDAGIPVMTEQDFLNRDML